MMCCRACIWLSMHMVILEQSTNILKGHYMESADRSLTSYWAFTSRFKLLRSISEHTQHVVWQYLQERTRQRRRSSGSHPSLTFLTTTV